MVHAIRIHKHGGPEVLRWESVEVPAPAAGEARVKHTAVGLNYIDVYHRTGLYPVKLPSGLGVEAAGVVEAVGPDVTVVQPGDRVAYAAPILGAYAEARVLPADRLVALPATISDEIAAAALLQGMTARYLLRQTYPVQAGDIVLVHAAAGGVGLILCQWAKALGAMVIGTVSTTDKAELAALHGCDHPILYTKEDFVARTKEITHGKGVAVVYDSVGKTTFAGSLDVLRPRGMLVSYGQASGPIGSFDPGVLSAKGSLFLTRPTLFTYVATRQELLDNATELFAVIADGRVKIDIGQRFPLRDAADAHSALETRNTVGSTLLIP